MNDLYDELFKIQYLVESHSDCIPVIGGVSSMLTGHVIRIILNVCLTLLRHTIYGVLAWMPDLQLNTLTNFLCSGLVLLITFCCCNIASMLILIL